MELAVTISQPQKRAELFGPADRNLRRIRDAFQVQLGARHNVVRVVGEPSQVSRAAAVLERLQDLLRGVEYLPEEAVDDAIAEIRRNESPGNSDGIWVFTRE
jgi:phosphate starvation-inducible PhoH-like protein